MHLYIISIYDFLASELDAPLCDIHSAGNPRTPPMTSGRLDNASVFLQAPPLDFERLFACRASRCLVSIGVDADNGDLGSC